MKEEERKLLEQSIRRKLGRLEKEIIELKELTAPVAPENAIGRLSRMEAINSKAVAEASLRNAEKRFKALVNALKKLNDPDFGLCITCKNEIPFQRLKLLPESTHCVKCA